MRTFDIVTEADARLLEVGSAIALAPGGHITPLAADTLRARRVSVLGGAVDRDLGALAPATPARRVAIGSDHSGLALKAALRERLRGAGIAVTDVGTHAPDPVDYPDIAAAVARAVARGEVDAGIVIDGAGLGSAMAANKVPGCRAAMCSDVTLARYAREHNGANVLTLGATLLSTDAAYAITETFLQTAMSEARYLRRLGKLNALDTAR